MDSTRIGPVTLRSHRAGGKTMFLRRRWITPALAAAMPAGGSASTPTTADPATAVVGAMGGRESLVSVLTIVPGGSGTRTRLGQIPRTGGEEPMGHIEGVTETIDLEIGRAAF